MVDKLLSGRYQRVRSLGGGAMGEVWLADDLLLGRKVAIKQLRPVSGSDLDVAAIERMSREARVAARLSHRNAVAVFDLIMAGGLPHVIMEYIDGESLAERIRRLGRLKPREAAELIGQVAAGLAAAHRAGIVHRDVKPANIMIDHEGTAKLADFGIARDLGDGHLTGTGQLLGTVAYMAPEVARTGIATTASDMWSLGATLYTAVEGHAPHDDGSKRNTAQLLIQLVTEPVTPGRNADVLQPLLNVLLAQDAEARPSAEEVGLALSALAAPGWAQPPAAQIGETMQTGQAEVRLEPPVESPPLPPLEPAVERAQLEVQPHPSTDDDPADATRLRLRAGPQAQAHEPETETRQRPDPPLVQEAESDSISADQTTLRKPLIGLADEDHASSGRSRSRSRRRGVVLAVATVAALLLVVGLLIDQRTAARRPGAITDLTIFPAAQDGMASIAFSKPASHGSKLYIHCEYSTEHKDCGTWQAGSSARISHSVSVPAGLDVEIYLQACSASATRRSSSSCDSEVSRSVVTHARLAAPVAGQCGSGPNEVSFDWTSGPGYDFADYWLVSVDGQPGRSVAANSYQATVSQDGAMHSLTVYGVDARGETGSPLLMHCRSPKPLARGSYQDPRGDVALSTAPVDISSFSWNVQAARLVVDVTVSTADLRKAVVAVWIDADHSASTGGNGIGCPEPGLDDGAFGIDYFIADYGYGASTSGVGSYCHPKAAMAGYTVSEHGNTFEFQIPLATIPLAKGFLLLKVGSYAVVSGHNSRTFQDLAPDEGLPAVEVAL